MKSHLALFFVVVLSQGCAQTKQTSTSTSTPVTVTKATQQRWAGGTVGRRGVRYSFTVEALNDVKLDTLWIGSHYFPLADSAWQVGRGSLSYNAFHDGTKRNYAITAAIDQSDDRLFGQEELSDNIGTSPRYDDAAYVVYTFNGKRNGVAIDSLQSLPTVNYP